MGKAKAQLTLSEVISEFGLDICDLEWMGRPASDPITERIFDRKDCKKLADLSAELKVAEAEESKARNRTDKARDKITAYIDMCDRIFEKDLAAAARKKEKAYAKERTELLKPPTRVLPHMEHSLDSKLPLDVWKQILELLCQDLDVKGVRGPSVVARDLCNASAVNKELYAASLPVFEHLSQLCKPIHESVPYRAYSGSLGKHHPAWEKFISTPLSVSPENLKKMECQVQTRHTFDGWSDEPAYSSNLRPIVARRLVAALQQHPTTRPARLVWAVCSEKHIAVWKKKVYELAMGRLYWDDIPEIWKKTVFKLRQSAVSRGGGSLQALSALKDE